MGEESFVYKNTYMRKIKGLYLNSETSDVNFVFGIDTDNPEKVPAHKAILSHGNQVFHAMFFGPIKEIGDIPISVACAAAFKEFLQFFYLDKVRLTSENIVQVINLCKMYEMNKCMKACETTLRKSLTIDDMCLGYSVALLHEQKNLIKFCEQKIKTNAKEILKSESFLESGRSTLEKILTLVTPYCSAIEKVNGCMEWAKAECNRNNLDTSAGNLRTQIGDLFSQMPFEKLFSKQFSQYVDTYNEFLESDEIAAITRIIESRILECDRRGVGTFQYRSRDSFTQFTSNKKLLLTKFYVPRLTGSKIEYRVHKSGDNYVLNQFPDGNNYIEFPQPLVIEAETFYTIYIEGFEETKAPKSNSKEVFQLREDICVEFITRPNDLVSRVIFDIPEN